MTLEVDRIYCEDCDIGMASLSDESVDCIFTDPPYISDQWEGAYKTLARHAARVLKPSGFCITYSPQIRLPNVLDILRSGGLDYYWQDIQLHTLSNRRAAVHVRRAFPLYKPILIFQKPPFAQTPEYFYDVIQSRRSKRFHPWQQSVQDAIQILCRMTVPGDVVLDPFVCTGTTAKAAKLIGRHYLGFEIDPLMCKVAEREVAQEPLDLQYYLRGAS
jgi:site-specific DNA-methyltransferase (adenine-specific)